MRRSGRVLGVRTGACLRLSRLQRREAKTESRTRRCIAGPERPEQRGRRCFLVSFSGVDPGRDRPISEALNSAGLPSIAACALSAGRAVREVCLRSVRQRPLPARLGLQDWREIAVAAPRRRRPGAAAPMRRAVWVWGRAPWPLASGLRSAVPAGSGPAQRRRIILRGLHLASGRCCLA